MTMKRILAMLLTLLMIIAVFAGCAGSGEVSEQSSKPTESSKTEESKADESSEPSGDTSDGPVYEGSTDPITFKLLMTTWQTWDEPMDADPLGRWLIDKTGVTIEPEIITGEAADKYALVLATKDYPDFMQWPGDDMASKFIAENAFVAYDEYLDKLPNVVSRYGDDIGAIYDIDTEHLYRITQWAMGNSFDLQQGMNFRSDFMREYFGDDSLTTPKWITISELEKAMTEWKESNPTNADGATTYPVTMDGTGAFILYFGQCYGISQYYDDGTNVGYYYTHPQMVEELVTLNRWYNNGLLDPEFAINKTENLKSKLSTGISIGTLVHESVLSEVNQALEAEDPDIFMFSHPKVKADDCDAIYEKYSGVGSGGLVTMTAVSDLDRALEWINFMNDAEVMFYCCNGLPGEDGFWQYDENGMVELNIDKISAGTTDLWDRFRVSGGYKYVWMLSEGIDTRFPAWPSNFYEPIHGEIGEQARENLGRKTFWDPDVDKISNPALYQGITPASDSDEGIIKAEVDDIWNYAIPEIIMAKDETAARDRYQQMVEEINDAGYEQWLSAVAEKYFIKKGILGL